ncbi:MAG: signal peptidase I [Thermincola sp.]|nr:signal peptidase I [Thermincola sp.]MDT3704540.1 signal peptidase I [Thermincola sp.]
MSQKIWDLVKDVLQVVVFALILTFILRSYIVEARGIPTGSMIPTLQIGDKLLVDKIYYKFSELQRGDIVVFAPPPAAQVGGNTTDFIKRVIGLQGDKIQVIDGVVYINDKPLTEPYINQKPNYEYGPVTVPEGALFVMGDNRNNSFDSHTWGFMPMENLKGRAFFMYWPPNRIGSVDKQSS